MSRYVKRMMIDCISSAISKNRDLIVVDMSKVSAISVNRMRLDLAESGVTLLCVKNAVASRVLSDIGLTCATNVFIGPSALVYGVDDIVTIVKGLMKYEESYKPFTIRSAIIDGVFLNNDDVKVIGNGPGKMELLSQISALMLSPGRKIVSTLSLCNIIANQIDSLSAVES